MFYFLHSAQAQDGSNESYYKGLLFEDLLRKYLGASGYAVTLSRVKHNSLEYDLEGSHEVDQHEVVGEAKALQSTISGSILTSFVGKMVPLHATKPNLTGLFLSVSALTPEAQDYVDNLNKTSALRVRTLCGNELEASVRDKLKLPLDGQVASVIRDGLAKVLSQHIVHTDHGAYVAAIGCGTGGAFPDRFALVDGRCDLIADTAFLATVRESLKSFQDLEPYSGVGAKAGAAPREIPRGLITSTGWTDYRRPANPTYFVGREAALARAESVLTKSGAGCILELKSRSGVGKSSMLALLADRAARDGQVVELHDARDVHAATDIFALVQRFSGAPFSVSSFEEVTKALDQLEKKLGVRHAIFLVDQFESTFQAPEVFHAYEFLALSIARRPGNMAMVFARKDDLLTTYDEQVVDLTRLRNLAESITLEDFSRTEAAELVSVISGSLRRSINSEVVAQVLEFAQGFPWLLKRTMAHVDGKLAGGVRPQELSTGGLYLEDLFEEELAELDEVERGYVSRLAGSLPSTYHELLRRFEGDRTLPRMLDKLTQKRILRLSAGTYDIYNDVFKEFLVYDRLPDRALTYLFRNTPAAVIRAFRAIGGEDRFEVSELQQAMGRESLISTYNVLRELRVVGLVERAGSAWAVPEIVRNFEIQNRLGEYLRQSVMKNRAVADFVLAVEREPFDRARVAEYLADRFPFLDVQADAWNQYAGFFLAWLEGLQFVDVSDDGTITAVTADRADIHRELGNLYRLVGRGRRLRTAPFIPSKEWSVSVRVLQRTQRRTKVSSFTRAEHAAAGDLCTFGACVRVGADSIKATKSAAEFEDEARALLADDPYRSFWQLLSEGTPYAEAIATSFPEAKGLGEATRKQLGQKLANWGRHFGHVKEGRIAFRKPPKPKKVRTTKAKEVPGAKSKKPIRARSPRRKKLSSDGSS